MSNKGFDRTRWWCHAIGQYVLPNAIWRRSAQHALAALNARERDEIDAWVAYYVRLRQHSTTGLTTRIRDYKYPFRAERRHSLYFFDLYNAVCRFDRDLLFAYLFDDITYESDVPAFVKSRPVADGRTDSAVLKLDALRHFRFVDDRRSFAAKRDMAVFRNQATQPHRLALLQAWHGHPMCDFAKVNRETGEPHPEWVGPFMSIDEQLTYKFILCIEGNDVATNLKWVMSSNSLAVMPRPRYETWFMEGALKPGVHYVEVKPDYTDLVEKMEHYLSHPDEARHIIENAHAHVARFADRRIELATQLGAAEAYFKQTGQL